MTKLFSYVSDPATKNDNPDAQNDDSHGNVQADSHGNVQDDSHGNIGLREKNGLVDKTRPYEASYLIRALNQTNNGKYKNILL